MDQGEKRSSLVGPEAEVGAGAAEGEAEEVAALSDMIDFHEL